MIISISNISNPEKFIEKVKEKIKLKYPKCIKFLMVQFCKDSHNQHPNPNILGASEDMTHKTNFSSLPQLFLQPTQRVSTWSFITF